MSFPRRWRRARRRHPCAAVMAEHHVFVDHDDHGSTAGCECGHEFPIRLDADEANLDADLHLVRALAGRLLGWRADDMEPELLLVVLESTRGCDDAGELAVGGGGLPGGVRPSRGRRRRLRVVTVTRAVATAAVVLAACAPGPEPHRVGTAPQLLAGVSVQADPPPPASVPASAPMTVAAAAVTTTATAPLRRAARSRTSAPPPATDCGGWRDLVALYPWPVDEACRVLWCESRGDPAARNGRYHGLMQVGGASFDPSVNIAQAYAMWARRGWQPWECRPW